MHTQKQALLTCAVLNQQTALFCLTTGGSSEKWGEWEKTGAPMRDASAGRKIRVLLDFYHLFLPLFHTLKQKKRTLLRPRKFLRALTALPFSAVSPFTSPLADAASSQRYTVALLRKTTAGRHFSDRPLHCTRQRKQIELHNWS